MRRKKARYHKVGYAQDRDRKLRRIYGITSADFQRMVVEQDGRCAICRELPVARALDRGVALHVDHNHKTGIVRGLLCWRCNAALGLLRDSPEVALAAVIYLGERG